MKKIAIVIWGITERAGTERAVCNLAKLLTLSPKYSVSIISAHSFPNEKPAYNINSNIKLYHLSLPFPLTKISRLWMYIKFIIILNKICAQENIDIVLGTSHGMNISLVFLNKKIKKIACEHFTFMKAPFFCRVLRRATYPFFNSIVLLTNRDAKRYSFHKNAKVIPNSLSFFPKEKSKLMYKRVLAVGRLTHEKGFDLLLDAIAIIKTECKGWEFKIIGSGEDEEALKRKIKDLNLCKMVNICPPTDAIMQEYIDASIFVLSSRFEGFGLVLIEAQSCGLPIVSFNCPEGPAEIVRHNENGFLVENGNTEGLSKAILEFMQNKEKRILFGERALQGVVKYSPENVFVQWDSLLDKI